MLPQQPVAKFPVPKLFLDWSCSIACGESLKTWQPMKLFFMSNFSFFTSI